MYEKCVQEIPKIPSGLVRSKSQIRPWINGITPPPKIIIIKKEEAFPVFFPSPAIAKSKMEGHMIDRNNPPEMKKNLAISLSG